MDCVHLEARTEEHKELIISWECDTLPWRSKIRTSRNHVFGDRKVRIGKFLKFRGQLPVPKGQSPENATVTIANQVPLTNGPEHQQRPAPSPTRTSRRCRELRGCLVNHLIGLRPSCPFQRNSTYFESKTAHCDHDSFWTAGKQ